MRLEKTGPASAADPPTYEHSTTSTLDADENDENNQQTTQTNSGNTKSPQEVNQPPNGGLIAWLQVLGSFILFFNSWGLINTFGVFQTFYSSTILHGSPILYGPLYDLGYPRFIVAFATFVVVFGSMMTSLCTQLWQFMLAQGIIVGLGNGALFLTAVAIVSTYFTLKKSLAMGIAASGSSIGGVVYPIVFRTLQPQIGFPWAVRTIGFITLGTNAIACVLIKKRVKPQGRRALFDAQLFKDVTFDLWSLAWFFGNMGLCIPLFFIQEYAAEVISEPFTIAFWTLTTINAASVFGRIIPGLIADKYSHPLLVITICTNATSILAFCWIAIRSTLAGMFVFCALYRFCSGVFVSLSTLATVHLAPTMDGLGIRLGVFNFLGSLGLLVGILWLCLRDIFSTAVPKP